MVSGEVHRTMHEGRKQNATTIARPASPRKRKQQQDEEAWIWVFQQKLRMLAKDKGVKWQAWRVLAYLMSAMTFGEGMPVRQEHLAAELDMPRPNVSRALRTLEAQGIVLRWKTPTGGLVYGLNNDYVYKGHGEDRKGRRQQQMRRQQAARTSA